MVALLTGIILKKEPELGDTLQLLSAHAAHQQTSRYACTMVVRASTRTSTAIGSPSEQALAHAAAASRGILRCLQYDTVDERSFATA